MSEIIKQAIARVEQEREQLRRAIKIVNYCDKVLCEEVKNAKSN